MKRRFLAGLLSFVMLWSLLPASALAVEEGADPDVKYGKYNDEGEWEATTGTGTLTPTGVKGVTSISVHQQDGGTRCGCCRQHHSEPV